MVVSRYSNQGEKYIGAKRMMNPYYKSQANMTYFEKMLDVFQNIEPNDNKFRSKDEYKIRYDRITNRDGSKSKYAFIDIPCEDLSFAFSKKTGRLAFIVNYKD
jgi:hypothetical protein